MPDVDQGRRAFAASVAMSILGWFGWYARESLKHVIVEPGKEAIQTVVHRVLQPSEGLPSPAIARSELVYDLFLSNEAIDIIPPSNWWRRRPDIRAGGVMTYGHEYQVLRAIQGFLPDSTRWSVRDEEWFVDPSHSAICLGSGTSNATTGDLVGDKGAPRWTVAGHRGDIALPYAMTYQEGEVRRLQYGEEVVSPASAINDSPNHVCVAPMSIDGWLTSLDFHGQPFA